jgi:hypothetical protein
MVAILRQAELLHMLLSSLQPMGSSRQHTVATRHLGTPRQQPQLHLQVPGRS